MVNNIVLVVVENCYSSLRHCRSVVCLVVVLTTATRLRDFDCNIAALETVKTQPCMVYLKMLLPLENAKRPMLADGALLVMRLNSSSTQCAQGELWCY